MHGYQLKVGRSLPYLAERTCQILPKNIKIFLSLSTAISRLIACVTFIADKFLANNTTIKSLMLSVTWIGLATAIVSATNDPRPSIIVVLIYFFLVQPFCN